jgi:NAD(P)H-dependent flavin oxidoreductase YrpB (nitropropane dioxygenase family)
MPTSISSRHECDAHINFKQAYLNAKAEDIIIIKSPVGLPGRVINNGFVEKIKQGKTIPFKCNYNLLYLPV